MHAAFRLPMPILACLTLTSLWGCSVLPSTKEPAPSQLQITVNNHNNERPVISVYKDDYDCFGIVGIELDADNAKGQADVPHKQFTTFQAKWIKYTKNGPGLDTLECDVTGTLDSSELTEITLNTRGSAKQCEVTVSGTNLDDDTLVVPYQARRLSLLTFYTEGPFCNEDPRFKGSSTYSKPRG